MGDYIENTNYMSTTSANSKEDSMIEINQSCELDELAEKLTNQALRETCQKFLTKEPYNKTRFPDMVSAICLLFSLLKISNNKPIYVVMDGWDHSKISGYYFYVGTHEDIKKKLLKLNAVTTNLK